MYVYVGSLEEEADGAGLQVHRGVVMRQGAGGGRSGV